MILGSNAELRFPVVSQTQISDPETGNPVLATTELKIQASLNRLPQGKTPGSTQDEIPGVNPTDVFLQGRAINPQTLPPQLLRGGTGTIEITDPVSGSKLKGDFLLLATVPSKYALVTQLLGHPIEGYMQNARLG